jgi:hypothetical protein
MKTADWLLSRVEDPNGYPDWAFECFYQQGLSCFEWGLTKPLVRQAFNRSCDNWKANTGEGVAMWQIRAFIYGLSGHFAHGVRKRIVSEDYQWPTPPDQSWELLVCVYPNGKCELDFVHSVGRRFWSQDNGFLDVPSSDPYKMNWPWFDQMGFELLFMNPWKQVQIVEHAPTYLRLT